MKLFRALGIVLLFSLPLFAQGTGGVPALNVRKYATDPSPCLASWIWYNTTSNAYKGCPNGVAATLGGAGSGVTSVSGTVNQIDVATGTTTPVVSLDANFLSNGGAMAGTFTGAPTFSGNIAFSGTPTFSNALSLPSGTTLIAPVLGTPASGTLTNETGLPIATGVSGLGSGVATALAAATNASGGVVTSPVGATNLPTLIGCPYGGTTGGTATAQTLTVPNIPSVATAGTCVSFIAGFNGTATTTLTVTPTGGSAYAAINLFRRIFNGVQAMNAVDEEAGGVYQAMYDGTQWVLLTTSSTIYSGGTLGGNKILTGNTNNSVQTSTATLTSGVLSTSNSVQLTADSAGITATTAATATTIFTFPALVASTKYSFHCSGTTTQATAGAGIGIAFQTTTTAATQMEAHATVATSTTAAGFQSSGNLTTTTESAIYTGATGTLTTQLPWYVDGSIEVGVTPPATFIIGFFSVNASDAVVVKRDSYCSLMP